MSIWIGILFIILFIILMVFVFSIAMLTKIIGKKEIMLIIVSSFIIGSLGGASFLYPIYEETPVIMSTFEGLNPDNEETIYLDVSSIKLDTLQKNLDELEGVKHYEFTGISFQLWKFTDSEYDIFNRSIGYMSSNYTSWYISDMGQIDINITPGTDPNAALKAFSDWYKANYGGDIRYGDVDLIVVVKSSELQNVKDALLEQNIVPDKTVGPVENSIEHAEENMLGFNEFTLVSGLFGILIAVIGIYFDSMVVVYRRFRRFLNEKIIKR